MGKYPNLVAPVGSIVTALEAISSGKRGRVAYQGAIYIAKAGEAISAYKECIVVDESVPRSIVERRTWT